MENRKGYKKTPLGWLPQEWEIAKLGDICNVKRGASPRPINDPKWFGGNVGWVRISDVTKSKKYLTHTKDYLSDEGVKNSVKIEKGEIILSICATIGIPIIVNMDACIHDGFVWFDNLPTNINRDFFYYFLQYYSNKIASNRQVGTQGNLNTSIISSMSFPIINFQEQQKIAAILATVDEKIAAIESGIEENEKLKKGLMQRLLTRGIGHSAWKETEIGRIPKEWEIGKLVNFLDIKSGQGFKYKEYTSSGIKLIKIDNIGWGKIIWENISYLPVEYLEKYPELILSENDVLLALNRPITQGRLKICMLKKEDIPSILYQRVGKIAIKSNSYNNKFLYYLLNHVLPPFILKNAVGSDQPFINIAALKEMALVLPSSKEQQKIAAILSTVDEKIEMLQEKKGLYETLKKGLLQNLLTGRIRVKTAL